MSPPAPGFTAGPRVASGAASALAALIAILILSGGITAVVARLF